jgi:hypothetical protein
MEKIPLIKFFYLAVQQKTAKLSTAMHVRRELKLFVQKPPLRGREKEGRRKAMKMSY